MFSTVLIILLLILFLDLYLNLTHDIYTFIFIVLGKATMSLSTGFSFFNVNRQWFYSEFSLINIFLGLQND